MTADVDIVVLRQKFHGLAPEEYAAALRDRLPDHEIRVPTTPAQEDDLLDTATVVTGSAFSPEQLAAATDIELFACAYAGSDHLPLETLRGRGVTVTTAAGVHAPNVAQQAIGYVLAHTRGLYEGRRRQQRNQWRSYPVGDLAGDTVTIVGMGTIGEAIATRLAGFDVETVGVRHTPAKGGPADEIVGYDALHEVLARTEHLILACPLTDTTDGLIGETELDALPPEALLVNVARGEVIDTGALVSALRRNHVGGAALDVTDPEPLPADHPLWEFENVTITPHNAGFTPAYHDRLADIVAENVRKASETGEYADLRNQVLP